MTFLADAYAWAEAQFGPTQLGDVRRSRRLVHYAAQMAAHPAGSIPRQTETWSDAKAVYRLFAQQDVTFEAVAQPHWDRRQHCGGGTFLILSDTTEIDYGKNSRQRGLGPVGNGTGRGVLLHSGLLVAAATGQLLCLAGARLCLRKPVPRGETSTQRLQRRRESERWGELIDQIGPPPPAARWIHVMDREADNVEVFCHCQEQGTDWVVRTRTLKRKIHLSAAASAPVVLADWLQTLPVQGQYTLAVASKAKTRREPARPGRTACMAVRVGTVSMPLPKQRSGYLRQRGATPLPMSVIWTREVAPPAGQPPVEWVLYTSLPVTTLAQAQEVLGYYQKRWTIEEWHKAIKTGTRVKARQLETLARLAPLIALCSIEAVRLLQLKSMTRTEPERPAAEVVPPVYLWVLRGALRGPQAKVVSVRDFFRGVARLGGFLARTGDGEPGWQTTWYGWEKLTLLIRGHAICPEAPD